MQVGGGSSEERLGGELPTKETGRDESERKRPHSDYKPRSQLSEEEPCK